MLLTLRNALLCAFLLSLTWLALSAALALRAVTTVTQALPAQLGREVAETRGELLAEVDRQATGIRGDAATQLNALRAQTLARVDAMQALLNKRSGEALVMADARLSGAQESLDGVLNGVPTVLANAATLEANYGALAKDAQDGLDDSYWDLKATIESANVAATSVAQTAETVRTAAPQIAASVEGIGKSADAIAGDVRREADDVTKPKRWWEKILGPVYAVVRIAAAF